MTSLDRVTDREKWVGWVLFLEVKAFLSQVVKCSSFKALMGEAVFTTVMVNGMTVIFQTVIEVNLKSKFTPFTSFPGLAVIQWIFQNKNGRICDLPSTNLAFSSPSMSCLNDVDLKHMINMTEFCLNGMLYASVLILLISVCVCFQRAVIHHWCPVCLSLPLEVPPSCRAVTGRATPDSTGETVNKHTPHQLPCKPF